MKIQLTKKGMTRWCQDSELELLTSAGWTLVDQKPNAVKTEQVTEQVTAVLRAPAKSKGADKSLDNANQQGDE